MGFFFNTEPQPNQPQQGHPQQQVAVAAPQGAHPTQEDAHVHQVPSTKPQTISSILGTNEFDASKLSPLPGLDKKTLDYFSLEESGSNRTTAFGLIPSRSWTDDVCYGTGAVYLLGLGVGGLWGAREELKASKGQPSKVRYNRMLNGMTRRGPFLGNSMGILAAGYNLINSGVTNYVGESTPIGSIGSAAITGMLFKSTAGIRTSLVSGAMCGGAVALWTFANKYYEGSASSNWGKKLH